MDILHIYKDYFPVQGGIENHVKMLAEAQAARGHTVSVLVASRDRKTHVETMNGARVIFAARLVTLSSTPLSIAMFDLLRREQPDIAHLHFPYPWGEATNYFFGRARRVVITYHSDIIRQKFLRFAYAPLMQRVLARADGIIATSPNYIASSPILARWKSKCAVVPLAIDPAPFENADAGAAQAIRSRIGAPLLLFVGRLRYYKGLQYLLHALAELPSARLIVIGTGPMRSAWRALARELGVAHRVLFAGEVPDDDLPAYYAACDVFVLPSSERSEAFGVVQLEAMAAGKPVVCTELGTGTSFVNVDGETGFVVPARDARALAAAITRLIDNDALRARMGAAGSARVRAKFTIDKMVERMLALYNNLIFKRK
ncbi:MAG: glycosyltransferase [Chloroflexota bacterium]|nr:glycosyltransferase [Chloroflexota bacterium]